jgi:hypothetical protein
MQRSDRKTRRAVEGLREFQRRIWQRSKALAALAARDLDAYYSGARQTRRAIEMMLDER